MDDVVIFGIINVHFLAAGLLGGLVHSFRLEKATPWQIVGHIVAGGLAANFLTPLLLIGASNFVSPQLLKILPPGFVSFGIGMSGRYTCYGIEKTFNSWNPLRKTKNE
jgi:hypothetical protein